MCVRVPFWRCDELYLRALVKAAVNRPGPGYRKTAVCNTLFPRRLHMGFLTGRQVYFIIFLSLSSPLSLSLSPNVSLSLSLSFIFYPSLRLSLLLLKQFIVRSSGSEMPFFLQSKALNRSLLALKIISFSHTAPSLCSSLTDLLSAKQWGWLIKTDPFHRHCEVHTHTHTHTAAPPDSC